MRPLLTLALGAAIGAPGGVLAQETAPPHPTLALPPASPPPAHGEPAPPPAFSEPVYAVPPAQTAAPPQPAVEAAPPPPQPTGPKTVAPVLVEAKPAGPNATQRVGTIVGGVAGGMAGAAAAGPVGKIAGGLIGKTVAKALMGGKSKNKGIPQVEVAEAPPEAGAQPPVALSAEAAAAPAVAETATAPQLEPVSGPPPS